MCFGGAKQTTASSSISSSKGQKPVTGVQAIGRNIAADVRMGAAAFGKGSATGSDKQKKAQIDALVSAGYTREAAADYQARTAASKARMAASPVQTEYGRKSISAGRVPSPSGISFARASSASASAPTPPSAPGSGEMGPAEEQVLEDAKKRKGRASTIETAPSGLLTEAKTRRRRSLMGGLIS